MLSHRIYSIQVCIVIQNCAKPEIFETISYLNITRESLEEIQMCLSVQIVLIISTIQWDFECRECANSRGYSIREIDCAYQNVCSFQHPEY